MFTILAIAIFQVIFLCDPVNSWHAEVSLVINISHSKDTGHVSLFVTCLFEQQFLVLYFFSVRVFVLLEIKIYQTKSVDLLIVVCDGWL